MRRHDAELCGFFRVLFEEGRQAATPAGEAPSVLHWRDDSVALFLPCRALRRVLEAGGHLGVGRPWVDPAPPRFLAGAHVDVLEVGGKAVGFGFSWVNPRFAGPWYVRARYAVTDRLEALWWHLEVHWLKLTGRW